jgi:uncharacterized membrane protein
MDLARAIAVAAVVSLALWPVQIDTAFGLPAHPLILHVPVVFVPLLGLAAIGAAATTRLRDRHHVALAAFSVVTLIATLLTAGAGKAFLEAREDEIEDKATLADHEDAGDALRFTMALLTLALVVAMFRRHVVLRGAIGLLAATAIFFVIRAGHLGATLAWGE